jgi:hypothetical protein
MAAGRGGGGASPAGSNHPMLACASAAPPYPRRGILSLTYVSVFSFLPNFLSASPPGSHQVSPRPRER